MHRQSRLEEFLNRKKPSEAVVVGFDVVMSGKVGMWNANANKKVGKPF